jgi:hypothetical protein
MWLLKSLLDQNSIVIYHKFNGDFKSHINFGGQKEDKGMMCNITLYVYKSHNYMKMGPNTSYFRIY